jgi:hypothetical protein
VNRFEPRSRGLPEGFLDQPFYGWGVKALSGIYPARFSGLIFGRQALAVLQNRLTISTLKRANEFVFTLEPGATSAALVTQKGKPRERGWLRERRTS